MKDVPLSHSSYLANRIRDTGSERVQDALLRRSSSMSSRDRMVLVASPVTTSCPSVPSRRDSPAHMPTDPVLTA